MLRQRRLQTRTVAFDPRLVRLHAPAGYGKAQLARFFALRFEGYAVCDCAGVAGIADFAGRAMSALGDEAHGDAVTLMRLRLLAAEADAASWSRHLLEAWKLQQPRSLVIFENAGALAGSPELLGLFGELLAARPAERVVLVSSREPLPVRYAHYFAPHEMLVLAREDLRCDRDEAAAAFEGTELSEDAVDRILTLTGGAPVTVQLLARFANYEANFEALLGRLEAVPCAGRHAFLVREVLPALTDDMLAVLRAVAAIGRATLEDIAAATRVAHPMPTVDRLVRLPGFLTAEGVAYRAHPVLLEALPADDRATPAGYLLRAARENERLGDHLRAAELHLVRDDPVAAARALDRLPFGTLAQPTARLADALTKIEMAILCRLPNLWCALLPYRRDITEPARLYDEAAELVRTTSSSAPSLQQRLRVRLAMFAQQLGKLVEARILLEKRAPPNANEDPQERRLALMTSALIAAKQGRFSEAERYVEEANAVHGARRVRFEAERAEIARERARLYGEWHGLQKLEEDALAAAQRSGVTSRVVDAAHAVATAAWFCNDDARVGAARQLLDDCGDAEVARFTEAVAAALTGVTADVPARTLAHARWHAALATADADRARALFDAAVEGIDAVENEFARIAVRVSAAVVFPLQRHRLLEARLIAAQIESPPLQASLEMLIDSPEPADYGMFKPIAARAARSPLKLRRDVLFLEILRGRVLRGGEVLRVSGRDFELLAALALLPGGTSKEQLAATIWPALDGDAALNALKMCVSRTRAELGDREAIVSTKRGYSLSAHVAVDVREIEQLQRRMRGAETLGEAGRLQLEDALRRLAPHERAFFPRWPWFPPHADRFAELRRELGLALAKEPAVTSVAAER